LIKDRAGGAGVVVRRTCTIVGGRRTIGGGTLLVALAAECPVADGPTRAHTSVMPIPRVDQFMSRTPVTIGRDQPMSEAHKLMRSHGIRHLPVLHGGQLVGLVSDRDLHLVETLRDVDPTKVMVEEAMSPDPYVVAPDVAIDVVVAAMADRKLGSAVVMRHREVLGIFTTVDALHAFAAVLRAQPRQEGL
jgi:acetoin utilization protein AcuB